MGMVLVGIAEFKIARDPDVLTTLGLGSCVGVTLYDPVMKIGGLAHIMLPELGEKTDQNRAKFADTAISDLIGALYSLGARRGGLVAKIAGGAHMFSGGGMQNFLKIGERNIAACKQALGENNVQLRGDDTGGTYGRTIELYTDTGRLKIKTIGFGEKFI